MQSLQVYTLVAPVAVTSTKAMMRDESIIQGKSHRSSSLVVTQTEGPHDL